MTALPPLSLDEVEGSLPARFARVAAARPDALAIAAGDTRLGYAELDARTDALAARIALAGPAPHAPVAVLATDTALGVVCVLAVWKAGRLCVPLNPEHPPAYLGAILGDAGTALVLADRDVSRVVAGAPSPVSTLRVDHLDLRERSVPPRPALGPGDPACLLYTSGSTGEPKGVLRSHRTILFRAFCSLTSHQIGADDRLSLLHSPSFSAGIRDVAAALCAGAALLPWDVKRAGPRALADWIAREGITVLGSGVSMLRPLLAEPDVADRLGSVRVVHLGSEPLYRRDVERFRARFAPGCLLVAGYGSTEFSPIAELALHHDTPLPEGRVPAGRPLPGAEVLILDEAGRPVSLGEIGVIAVRSRYLSDGYWRRPELTGARYGLDPADPAMRIYRTGDVGRLSAEGNLEVLGREDEQVKVRGFRLTLGQVEAALTEHPAVRHAVVTAPGDTAGDVRLVAYLVPGTEPPPMPGALRRFLRERLPDYMVPSAFVLLDAMPLNANGKADRAALPPPPERTVRRTALVAPRTPLQHQIAAIWEDLFGIAPIGASDDFFDLGGDSLLAAALASALEDACGRPLAPGTLLEAPTVEALAAALVRPDAGLAEPLTVLRASGSRAPLVFVHNDRGRGLYTYALGRALHPDRPMYAIHLHGLSGPPLPDSVEAIAADRVCALRAARPRGPYALGGHCYGGVVALEMARQLVAAGERVEGVALIDTPAPGRRARALHRAAGVLGRATGLSPRRRAALVARADRAAEDLGDRARTWRIRVGSLARAGWRVRVAMVGRGLSAAGRRMGRAAGRGDDDALHRPPPDVAAGPWQAYRRAILRYVPEPYAGRVTLFRAQELCVARADLGWRAFLPQLEIEVVPGDHHGCVTRHVKTFAARLEAHLERGA